MAKDTLELSELERCRHWIEAALLYTGGTHQWEDIVEGIKASRMQLWPSERGCIVTEIVVYPRKKVLNIFLAGGELDQILDMNDDVRDWAKSHGCEAGIISGRIGWKKPLLKDGWKLMYANFQKEIE